MKYFIGADGGGTSTKFVLVNEKLEIISSVTEGPSNFFKTGDDNSALNLINGINSLLNNSGITLENITSISLGLAGAERKENAGKIKSVLLEKDISLNSTQINIFSDAASALEGAFAGKPGIILIAGTGSILYAKDEKNSYYRVGGFGFKLGDEGGGYSIGQKALNIFSKYLDGREKESLLTELIKQKYRITDLNGLISLVYNTGFNIAETAEVVIAAAEKTDENALLILDKESDELIEHIKAVTEKMKGQNLLLSLFGSLITNNNFYSAMIKRKIKNLFPFINIHTPEYSPEIGAILLSQKK